MFKICEKVFHAFWNCCENILVSSVASSVLPLPSVWLSAELKLLYQIVIERHELFASEGEASEIWKWPEDAWKSKSTFEPFPSLQGINIRGASHLRGIFSYVIFFDNRRTVVGVSDFPCCWHVHSLHRIVGRKFKIELNFHSRIEHSDIHVGSGDSLRFWKPSEVKQNLTNLSVLAPSKEGGQFKKVLVITIRTDQG